MLNELNKLAVTYEQRIVAFIDILGFSDLVAKDLPKVEAVVGFIRGITLEQEVIFNDPPDPAYLQISFISDSIVISAPLSSERDLRFWNVIRAVGSICLNLLAMGVPSRGAIVTGQLFHHREPRFFDAVVGPALVKAYCLEKSVAIYPRVVFDDDTHQLWKKYLATERELNNDESWAGVVKLDQDGQSYLNILHQNCFLWSPLYAEYDKLLHAAYSAVIRSLEASSGNGRARIHQKYEWLASQFRSSDVLKCC